MPLIVVRRVWSLVLLWALEEYCMTFVPAPGAFSRHSLFHPLDSPALSCCVEVERIHRCLSPGICPGRMVEGNHKILPERVCGVPGMLPVLNVVCPYVVGFACLRLCCS